MLIDGRTPEEAARFYQGRGAELAAQVAELHQEVAKLKGLIKENATTFATLLRDADAATATQRSRAEALERELEGVRRSQHLECVSMVRINTERLSEDLEKARARLETSNANAERLSEELSRVRRMQVDDNTHWEKELRDSLRRAYKMACEQATKQDEKVRELEHNLRGKNEAIAHRDEKLRRRGDELTRLRTMLGNYQRVTGFTEEQVRDAAQAGMGMYRTHPGSPVFRAPTEVVGKSGEAGAFIPYGSSVIDKSGSRRTGYEVVGFNHRGVIVEWKYENFNG